MQTSDVLAGRVAVVTGAARGLGFHFADALIGAGAKVAMLARSADALREAAEKLGPSALAIPTDITSVEAVQRAFAATTEAFGGVDILVNNATLNGLHRIEQITEAELQAEVGVNLFGAIYCMREAIPLMRARGAGDIVNVSSETVMRPLPYLTLYAATKAAMETLTVGAREELRGDRIRVTTLRSGVVASGGAFYAGFAPDRIQAFLEINERGGYAQTYGTAIAPQIASQALVHLLAAPHEAHLDMVSVRAI